MGVDSFCDCGSAGDSPRPTPDTADFTPGTSITRRIASRSMRSDSASEMLGTRSIAGTTEPSFISGMKAVPRKGSSRMAPTKAATASITVFLVFFTAHSSIGT